MQVGSENFRSGLQPPKKLEMNGENYMKNCHWGPLEIQFRNQKKLHGTLQLDPLNKKKPTSAESFTKI
jgi:hypothetical protein